MTARDLLGSARDARSECRDSSLEDDHPEPAQRLRYESVVLLGREELTHDSITRLRRNGYNGRILVVVGVDDVEGSRTTGSPFPRATGCPEDPDSSAELRSAIPQREADAVQEPNSFRLDALTKSVRCGDERVRVSRTELSILAVLMKHAPAWVSSRALLSEALRTHHDDHTSLARVHVYRIRRKLGFLGACIESARGRGYRFAASSLQLAHATSVSRQS